ncbi:MMPL family transporter [Paenibacillus sonchi]|uniref:MMPL family transporter n=1 Tax=Paenibacillus sonchi TaxID=373687 RepID=A0A974PH85_9BACL|nr:MMPL family transporter [Paenibacillus sonchi]QQZ63884.1 MMPL family transporter [Paenibacillus sonchi]
MAKMLYRLGFWSAKNRIKVIIGSIMVLLISSILAMSMGPKLHEETTIPGLESIETMGQMYQEFPSMIDNGGQIQLVMKATANETLSTETTKQLIITELNELEKDPAVTAVSSPYENQSLNTDGTIGYATISYNTSGADVTEISKGHVLDAAEALREAGLQAELTGSGFVKMEIGGATEGIGVLIALVVLTFAFGSFLTGIIPVLTAVIGLGTGVMLIIMGSNFLDTPSFALSLASMIGLAVGIDYALFIISRYRQQLAQGFERREAIAIANGTAGSAVVFAGITVIIGLAGMTVVDIPFLTAMGLAAALCIFVAVLIAIITVPAVLDMMGGRIKVKQNKRSDRAILHLKKKDRGNRWGRFVTARPWLTVIFGLALLGTLSVPFLHMETGTMDDGLKSTSQTERRAYDLMSEAYGVGYHNPLMILAKTDGSPEAEANLAKTVEKLKTYPNIGTVAPAVTGASGNLSLINVIPATGHADVKTVELVKTIRSHTEEIAQENHVELKVTGSTAINIDISQKLNEALPEFCLIIVGLAFLLLMMVFRSILVPIKAVLGFVLSLGATLGFITYVVQDGHFQKLFGFNGESLVLNFLPIMVVGILFGLAMDYEVFLVSRMREDYKKNGDAKKSVLAGIRHSGGVVTAAGLIMISVFAGFMMTTDPSIKVMSFALLFGVLFDAFIVRLLIVPGVMILLGKAAWYLPKWLDRILPNLDVEGEEVMKIAENRQHNSRNASSDIFPRPVK